MKDIEKLYDENRQRLKRTLMFVKKHLETILEPEKFSILLGDHYEMNNCPVYIVLEMYSRDASNEVDYRLTLSVNFAHCDSSNSGSKVDKNTLYNVVLLNRTTGELVDDSPMIKLDMQSQSFEHDFNTTVSNNISFIESQIPTIIIGLKGYVM